MTPEQLADRLGHAVPFRDTAIDVIRAFEAEVRANERERCIRAISRESDVFGTISGTDGNPAMTHPTITHADRELLAEELKSQMYDSCAVAILDGGNRLIYSDIAFRAIARAREAAPMPGAVTDEMLNAAINAYCELGGFTVSMRRALEAALSAAPRSCPVRRAPKRGT